MHSIIGFFTQKIQRKLLLVIALLVILIIGALGPTGPTASAKNQPWPWKTGPR
jgi:hypothetical protein